MKGTYRKRKLLRAENDSGRVPESLFSDINLHGTVIIQKGSRKASQLHIWVLESFKDARMHVIALKRQRMAH
jgi:hypothetical protein